MTTITQPKTSYSDTTPHKRVITDVISLIDPADAPFVDAIGGLDGASSKFRFVNGKSTVVEWLEDTYIGLAGNFDASASVSSANTVVKVADKDLLQKGMIIEVGAEHIWVSDKSVDTLTLVRAVGGTTAASFASNAAFKVIGMARLEGSESDAIGLTDVYTGSNYTQIFHKEIKISRTQQMLAQYGISDEMAYQGDKAVPELMRLIERHLMTNKGGNAGSASAPRMMGGLQALITANKVAGTSLTKAAFDSAVKLAFLAGGAGPWIAAVSPTNLAKIVNFYDNTTLLRVDRTETTVGMNITQILTPFGLVNLVLDRWALDSVIPIVDPAHAGMHTYYPFTQEALAKGGDYDRSEVVGEFTFTLRQDGAHALLTAVT